VRKETAKLLNVSLPEIIMKYRSDGPGEGSYPLEGPAGRFEGFVYVSKEMSRELFGKIDIEGAEKSFAAAKCCMCCKC
jgi:hypothetical protein